MNVLGRRRVGWSSGTRLGACVILAAGMLVSITSTSAFFRDDDYIANNHVALAATWGPAARQLTGSFLQPPLVETWTGVTRKAEWTTLKTAGLTTQILEWTADTKAMTVTDDTGIPGYTWNTDPMDVPDRMLGAAENNSGQVFVGLQTNSDWWTKHADDATWLDTEATRANAFVDELCKQYGPCHGDGGYDSFAGWYLPFQMDNVNFATSVEWLRMANFYNTIVTEIKSKTPDLPVAIAPFFNVGAAGAQTPAQWQAMWTYILNQVPIDIIAVQDGVGDGHATVDDLPAWFAATKAAITAARPATKLYAGISMHTDDTTPVPLSMKTVAESMAAVSPYVTGYWSFSYDRYYSPKTSPSPAYDASYRDYRANGTVDSTAPASPAWGAASATGPSSVQLSWNTATDAVGVAGYQVSRNGTVVARVYNTTTYTDTGLSPSTAYSYTVTAFDGAANTSDPSSAEVATTPAS